MRMTLTGHVKILREDRSQVRTVNEAMQTWLSVDSEAGMIECEHGIQLSVRHAQRMVRTLNSMPIKDIGNGIVAERAAISDAFETVKALIESATLSGLALTSMMFKNRAALMSASQAFTKMANATHG